jgi:TonB family protein
VSFRGSRRWFGWVVLALVATSVSLVRPFRASGQEQGEITRKVKSKVSPVYPDIARKMNISGIVKLVVVVTPSGSVKSTKVLGGHPLLINAAEDAVKKWKFEVASEESSGVVEFSFKPEN